MQLTPNLVFNGIAETVLAHYHDALGGELEIMRFADSPVADSICAEWAGKVMYGSLRSPAGTINIMDAPPDRAGKPGDNFVMSVQTESEAQTDAVFAKLAEGGTVIVPLAKTLCKKSGLSQRFGMLTDKFGTKWTINQCQTVGESAR